MLRRLRRSAPLFVAALSLSVLTACGGEVVTADSGPAEDGFAAFTVSGEPGKAPEVEWKGRMDAGAIESETLSEGDGDEIATGDSVVVNYTFFNGYDQKQTLSTYDEDSGGPETLPLADDDPIFGEALPGTTVGSRLAIIGSAEEMFGEVGNPDLGIGNADSVLVVVDVMSKAAAPLTKPEGTQQKAPAWVPKLTFEKGLPVGFRFQGSPKPAQELQVATLIKGDGAKVTSGQTITVNYLGQVYGAGKPFDESYSKQPYETPIGTGSVVQGWDQGLVGQTVGSRVVLNIPSDLGYGDEGNPQAKIKGGDSLYFVVDLLAAN